MLTKRAPTLSSSRGIPYPSRSKLLQTLLVMFGSLILSSKATSCTSGKYWKVDTYCAVCEPGSYCPGGDPAYELSCNPGEYSGFGASSCTPCDAGWYCSSPSALPIPCPKGQYSMAGSTSCTPCLDGYNCKTDGTLEVCSPGDICDASQEYSQIMKCPAGNVCADYTLGNMVACNSGSYALEGSTECKTCPMGHYCPTTTASPIACPSGTVNTSTGQTTLSQCTACPAGYKCANADEPPTACLPGTFAIEGSSTCSNCPAGASCADPTADPVPCEDGFYSSGSASACQACPAGKSCTQSAASDCSSGTYSPTGEMECLTCPAGYDCSDKKIPTPCEWGYYSTGGTSTCTICPIGSACPLRNASPQVCPLGKFTDSTGQIECLECPDGYTCVSGTITRCSEGQMTDQSHQSCQDCPAGYACPGRQFELIVPCSPGQYSGAGDEYCTTTKAGYFAVRTDQAVAECADGYWSEGGTTYCNRCMPGWECGDKTGRHNQVCFAGFYSDATGTCQECSAGYFCPTSHGGYASTNGIMQCDPSSKGILWSDAGQVDCNLVPLGSFWDTGSSAVAVCTNLNTYSDGKDRCQPCPSNHECAFGKSMAHCPAFFYAPDASGDCEFCPDGKDCRQISLSPQDCGKGFYAQALDYVCVPCPKGYYCPNTNTAVPVICSPHTFSGFYGQDSCDACPTGYYAPAGSDACTPTPRGYMRNTSASSSDITHTSVLTACPDGQFSDLGQDTCTDCPLGFLCPAGTGDESPWAYSCPRGSYCIDGVETKCSAGTYNSVERAYSSDFCITCPAGYYCEEGAEHFSYYPCPLGHYCAQATAAPTACAAGTYNDNLFGVSVGDCRTCPMGHECGEATTDRGAVCQEGYYCPIGSAPQQFPCPKGTYGGYRTGKYDLGQCMQCPAGHYCGEGTATPTAADPGYWSPLTGLGDVEALQLCPPGFYCPNSGMTSYLGYWCAKGHYCPAGSSSATGNPCPAGTYTDSQDLFDPLQCTQCPRGYKCLAGASTGTNMELCDENQYCPFGTANTDNYVCPIGTYSPFTGSYSMDDCLPCPPGEYCEDSTGGQTCPVGYYCPEGTISPTEHPCPPGYYSDETGLIDVTQCKHCGVGNYCNSYALLAADIQQCAPGTYNNYTTTAEFCQTCPAGFICTNAGTVQPQKCPKGKYSAEGATACSWCPAGHYCPYSGISEEQMENLICPRGTLCISDTQQTIDSVLTDVGLDVYPNNNDHACPQYKYCPRGALVALDIPLGTTQLLVARGSLVDAIELPAGMYEKEQTLCTIGHYCPPGSSVQTPCPKGTFRDNKQGMDTPDCGKCPAGTYCPSEGMSTPTACPEGSFCPEGSQTHQLCPAGTYNPDTGATDSRDCTPCPAGRYCPYMGQTAVDDVNNLCDAGYFCRAGASRPEPTDGITGNECPQGRYCPKGTTYEVPCPAGQFNAVLHATSEDDCIDCWAGYYCPGSSSAGPFNKCPETYYCPSGTANFAQQPRAGEYAPTFSSEPLDCARGTYSTAALADCLTCPAGKFCNSIGLPYDPDGGVELPACPNGYYCPSYLTLQTNNISYDKQPCPMGTYFDQEGAKAENECIDCPAGQFCDQKAMVAAPTTNFCAAGYWCTKGAQTPFPDTTRNGYYGPCTPGSYCEEDSSEPVPCPEGTYSNQERATSQDFCLPCPPGKLCLGTGNTTPSDDCSAGQTCTDGINETPTTAGYAPIGSSHQKVCPPGFYQQDAGKGFCNACPSGSYCIDNIINACPEGRYCP